MEQLLPALLVVAVLVLVLVLIWFGWRSRMRRDDQYAAVPQLPATLGEPVFAVDDAHYVATTNPENALDRLAIAPLAYRGRASVEVHPEGVAIGVSGERAAFIPADRIIQTGQGTASIDRVVEKDGLIVIRWELGDRPVDTVLRIVDPEARTRLRQELHRFDRPAHPLTNHTAQETA